jgi:hypothetical protein
MLADVLAVTIGSFELLILVILLAMPVLLTILHVMLVSWFRKNRLNPRMTEVRLLSDLAQLENQSKGRRDKDMSPSIHYDGAAR